MNDTTPANEPRARFAPWLLEPMRENRGTYLKVAAAAALINVFALVTSLFSMVVYDRVIPNNATSSLVALTIGLAVVVVFDFVLKMLRAYFVDVAGADIDHQVGARVFDKLLRGRLDMRKGSTGALAGLMRELEALRDFFASATLSALVDVPFLLLTLAVIAAIGGELVVVQLIIVPLVLAAAWITNPAIERLTARQMREGLNKQAVLVEAIGGLETVKTSGAGAILSSRWARALAHQSDASLRQRFVSTVSITLAGSASTISYAATVIVGVALIADGRLTSGGLVACSLLAGRAIAPLTQISQLLTRLSATRAAYRQIDTLMRQPSEGPAAEPLRPRTLEGRIELRDVTFRYPGTNDAAVRDVSFVIEPGERVALMGKVGSGKSTLMRLMLGLYEPQEGAVLIDGTDVRQLDPAVLRSRIGVALQESVLLSGSVRENIVLARAGIDDDAMLRAATLSGTHQFMAQLANGYDLKLADRGEGLSGGQRQSIAIARALAGSPAMLMFDEPTSAMDARTEQALIDRLEAEVEGRTTIVVTHRQQLLQLVRRTIVMEGGRVAIDGPRDLVTQHLLRKAA